MTPDSDRPESQAKPPATDAEPATRQLPPRTKWIVSAIAVLTSLFHIVVLAAYPLEPLVFRSTTLFFTSVLAFALLPGWKGAPKDRIHWVDFLLIAASILVYTHTLIEHDGLVFRMGVAPTTLDVICGFFLVVIVLEMARRTMGLVLPLFAILLLAYLYVGPWLPGLFAHPGYGFARSMSFMYGMEAIFGIPLGMANTFVMAFLILGAFLHVSRAREFIMDLAFSLAGKTKGGPAKVAVVASSLFGTMSGSTIGNVAATGQVTIPMMKRVGYRPEFAGAVEAVASTGGTIMPPILGAAAFIMVGIVGVPYSTVAIATLIPAILYYLAVFWMVHLRAELQGLPRLEDDQIPSLQTVMRTRGYLALPIVILVYTMFGMGMSPIRAGLLSALATILISWFRRDTRVDIKRALQALESAAVSAASVVAAVAISGVLIGVFAITGLGLKFTDIVLSYSRGDLLLTMVFTMFVCLMLGMGMPTTGAYIICAALAAPSLVQLGIEPIIAHLFVLYFANMSNITPPVALASLTAASLAHANGFRTAIEALKLGIVGILIPYLFVFGPSLLARGSLLEIVTAAGTGIIGVIALGSAVQGWFHQPINVLQRSLLFIGSLLLMDAGYRTDLMGILLIGVAIVSVVIGKRLAQRHEWA